MDKYTIDESQYKNGYAKGYEDGIKGYVKTGRLGNPYLDDYYGQFADCADCGRFNVLPCHYCRNCGRKIVGVGDEQA